MNKQNSWREILLGLPPRERPASWFSPACGCLKHLLRKCLGKALNTLSNHRIHGLLFISGARPWRSQTCRSNNNLLDTVQTCPHLPPPTLLPYCRCCFLAILPASSTPSQVEHKSSQVWLKQGYPWVSAKKAGLLATRRNMKCSSRIQVK